MLYSSKKYFAGANSPIGFRGYFESIIPPSEASHIYCIKGGPGVGKSTFMKKTAETLEKAGHRVSRFHCPSDPASLDAILDEDTKTAWLDGTAPHTTDPLYPGAAASILDFGMFFNTGLLKERRKEIISLTDSVSQCFLDAKASLKPVATIYENVKRIYKKSENERAAEKLYENISEELFSDAREENGKIRKLFLSAITPDGMVSFANETLASYDILVLDSFPGDLACRITERLAKEAAERKINTELFFCPLSPLEKTDHIVFPSLNRAVTVSNSYHLASSRGRRVDISDCYYGGIDTASVSRAMETSDALLARGIEKLAKARELHSKLEKLYIDAMDYTAMNEYAGKTVIL